MSFNFSIYIPRMSIGVCECYVREEFENKLGRISRIDFTTIDKKPGFGENVDNVVKSAFVHFERYCDCNSVLEILAKLDSGKSHRFYPSGIREYWLLLKAKNPIQDTLMNNAQIVENCRFLEKKVNEQEEKINNQEEKIQKLEEKLQDVHDVVYQLVGGLFNPRTQRGMLKKYLHVLFPNEEDFKNTGDEVITNIWPTTRQGDECETRIAALEAQIKEMTNSEFYDNEDQDEQLQLRKQTRDNHSVSTHSSMPDLIDDDGSVSTHSSMPELLEYNSDDSVERIRNSCELCGNE
jgi:hypothetical protein